MAPKSFDKWDTPVSLPPFWTLGSSISLVAIHPPSLEASGGRPELTQTLASHQAQPHPPQMPFLWGYCPLSPIQFPGASRHCHLSLHMAFIKTLRSRHSRSHQVHFPDGENRCYLQAQAILRGPGDFMGCILGSLSQCQILMGPVVLGGAEARARRRGRCLEGSL